ncbi:MAG: HD domain-containing protein [Bacteroidales bacterium]|nr:HD domain-containing protein [Bacteroidales bacterium]
MQQISSEILIKAKSRALKLLEEKLPENLIFHTSDHTHYVANAVEEIGKTENLDKNEMNLVKLCAWFHDTGYTEKYEGHEEVSAGIVRTFLEEQKADEMLIKNVEKIIMATKIPQRPSSKLANILCDADLKHLSEPNYYDFAERIRQEKKLTEQRKISKLEFDLQSVEFFKLHNYHTTYGKEILQKGKEKNLAMIEDKIIKREKKNEAQIEEKDKELDKLQKKLDKKKGYSRGVESMFRLTARNQINLSSIADNKSNILISVNTIIISILLSVLVSRFSEYPNIILPTLIFLLFSLITIIFAILSTRPNISSGTFSKEEIKEKKVNLLFFGNFYNMSLDDYEWGLEEMMRDDDHLYGTMIKDQYFLGKVLAKKYKWLRIAYNFFMFGLIISVIAYVLAFTNI